MPVLNGIPYVEEAVKSVLTQSFRGFELIVIDDGSTDGTADYLASLGDPRLIVITNDSNLGRTPSLNMGLRRARAEFIARHDADDVSHSERLGRQVAFLDAHPRVGLLGTSTRCIDSAGERARNQPWPIAYSNAAIQQQLLAGCCFIHGSVMMRREALEDAGGRYDESWPEAEDYELWLRMTEGWNAANLPEVLYSYRHHQSMASVIHHDLQAALVARARELAVSRRLAAGWAAVTPRIRRNHIPGRTVGASRAWLAERYAHWSAAARQHSRWHALQFLLISLMLKPSRRDTWRYMEGIVRRKLRGQDSPAAQAPQGS
jgi:glycosyltransferase involved in cell wall biosynthesis